MITAEEANNCKKTTIEFMESVIENAEKLEHKENDMHHAKLKQIKDNRDELVNYYRKQAAYYEQQASHARILHLCLTGRP